MALEFKQQYVTDGTTKARVWYSLGSIWTKLADGSMGTRECLTVYAKDYGAALGALFPEDVENASDIMSDYFEKSRVRIFPGDPNYAKAVAAMEAANASRAARQAKREAVAA